MSAYPDRKAAEELLDWAGGLNPGPWTEHSRVAARVAETIAKKCGLDADKAYALGLLHDIGRYEGVSELNHVCAGERLMKQKGFADCARICLTHSFPVQAIEAFAGGDWDVNAEALAAMREELAEIVYDEYDRLIQLSDAIGSAKGVCLMPVRLMDVIRRHGLNNYSLRKLDAQFALKDHFDALCGMNIYDLFYDEICRVSIGG